MLAFACTAGPGQSTWLHMSDVYVECDADGAGGNPPTSYWNVPVGKPGNRAQTPGGVSATFGATRTRAYELEGDLHIGGCCLNPCCTTPVP